MNTNDIIMFSLNSKEKQQIIELVEMVFEGKSLIKEEILEKKSAIKYIEKLPKRLIDIFSTYKHDNEHIALLIKENPFTCDNLVSTPSDYRDKKPFLINKAEFLHGLYSYLLGKPYGLRNQQDEVICNRIIPVEGKKNIFNHSGGSANNFDFHTEDAFLKEYPDYISLYCLRNYEEAFTNLSYVKYSDLSKKTLDVLLKEKFEIKPNSMYGDKEEKGVESNIISLNKECKYLSLRVNFNMIDLDSLDEIRRNAISELKNVINNNTINLVLDSGNSIYINNNLSVHSRTSYDPFYGNFARWLCRIIIKKSA